jgi:hypothetical protein
LEQSNARTSRYTGERKIECYFDQGPTVNVNLWRRRVARECEQRIGNTSIGRNALITYLARTIKNGKSFTGETTDIGPWVYRSNKIQA